MNKLELFSIKFIIGRLKSKSPKEYAILTNACIVLGTAVGIFGYFHADIAAIFPKAANALNFIGNNAATVITLLASVGLVSKTTTTDPELMEKQLGGEINDLTKSIEDESKKN